MPALIRARHPQMFLALLAERHPGVHADLAPTLACAERVTQALPVEWIPVQMDIEVIEAVAGALSPAALAALVAERQRREMGSALFKTFVATALKLFGGSPATIVRHLPRGWSQVFSDCGEIEVVTLEPREAVVLLRRLPAVCLASDPWVDALPAGMRVLFELVKTRGDVTVERRATDVELRFCW